MSEGQKNIQLRLVFNKLSMLSVLIYVYVPPQKIREILSCLKVETVSHVQQTSS